LTKSWNDGPVARALARAAVPLMVTLAAFGVRVLRLDAQSLWLDETVSAYLTSLPLAELLLDRARNFHSPGYFLLLSTWVKLAGKSEFSLRYFSVLSAGLFAPLLYWASRLLFRSKSSATVAAILGAFSSVSMLYAQEVRMYSMLPNAYLLTLVCVLSMRTRNHARDWARLVAIEALCLYLHVFTVFILVVVNVLALVEWIARADRSAWGRRWITSQFVVALLFAPWLCYVLQWGGGVPANLVGSGAESGIDLFGYLRLTWGFVASGLVGIGHLREVTDWAQSLAVLLLMSVPIAVVLERRRRELLSLLVAFVVPLMAAFPVWAANPSSHPRYLLYVVAPLVVLAARMWTLMLRRRVSRVIAATGIAVYLANGASGFWLGSYDPRFAKLDMRNLAKEISQRSDVGDAVIMPPGDTTLWYYDPAPAELVHWTPGFGPDPDVDLADSLTQDLRGRGTVHLVQYRGLFDYDPRDVVPFLLENCGRLLDQFTVDEMDVQSYALEADCVLPGLDPTEFECGPLTVQGVYSQQEVGTGSAATVALRWGKAVESGSDFKVGIRIRDEDRQLAATDVPVLDEAGRPVSQWPVGKESVNYYVLSFPVGTPPLGYTLSTTIYNVDTGDIVACESGSGDWLPLGQIHLKSTLWMEPDPYGSWADVEWQAPLTGEVAPGLLLEGYTFRPVEPEPGDTLYVSLRWRALSDSLEQVAPLLELRTGGLSQSRVPGGLFDRFPTERWSAGDLLVETRELVTPATLRPLFLTLDVRGHVLEIVEVKLSPEGFIWEVPDGAVKTCARFGSVATLLGYDWSSDGVTMLYWRPAGNHERLQELRVFAHLVDADGNLLAQHDGPPGESNRREVGWLPGELVVDPHLLPHQGPADVGAHFKVGLYNPETMERLPAYDCSGARLGEDALVVEALGSSVGS
jgi:hypothetical protein